jgi:hypothetical protein
VHHPPVLAIGDLVTSGGLLTVGQQPAVAALGLVVGVQLADQLGVAALGLDHGQPVEQGGPLPRPILRGAPGMLLDQQPLVAAVLQVLTNPSATSGGGQGHLGRGEALTRPSASPPKMGPKWCCQARTGRPRRAAIAAGSAAPNPQIRQAHRHTPTSSRIIPSGSPS